MRIDPIEHEDKPADDYARELDAEAYGEAESPRDRVRVINDVSYLRIGEAAVLYNLYAEAAEAGLAHLPALEIGARFGCSTLALALAIADHEGAPLVSIDPHGFVPSGGYKRGSFDILASNLRTADLAAHVTPVLALSEIGGAWWRHPVCLVFIDGDHTEEAVARDIELFAPHVAEGGILCGHDYQRHTPLVADAVDEYAEREGLEVEVLQSIWVMRLGAQRGPESVTAR